MRKSPLAFGLLFITVLAPFGCSKTNAVEINGGNTVPEGKVCSSSGECGGGACVAGFCRRACDTDATCPTDSICLGDGTASGCRLSEESQCSDKCGNAALACGIDGTCRMPCKEDKDCPRDGSVCIASTCVNSGETGAALTWFSCPGGVKSGLVCDGSKLHRCNGTKPGAVLLDTCASSELCAASVAAGTDECKAAACKAGEVKCQGADGASLGKCRADLTGFDDTVTCETSALCEQLRSDVEAGTATAPFACPSPACEANDVRCEDGKVLSCNDGRTGYQTTATCGGGTSQCDPGKAECIVLDIDPREVKRAEYKAFLDAIDGGTVPSQAPACFANTSFLPEGLADWPAVAASAGDFPITYVDWCDAWAYCAWKGRRLCGSIGGGPVAANSFADPGVSQWMNACSSGGQYTATYGNWDGAGHADTCNGNKAQLAATGSFVDCHSPAPGYEAFLDLTGNAAEWEDACTNGGQCHVRGGSFASNLVVAQLGCAADRVLDRTARAADVGFRCCAD